MDKWTEKEFSEDSKQVGKNIWNNIQCPQQSGEMQIKATLSFSLPERLSWKKRMTANNGKEV